MGDQAVACTCVSRSPHSSCRGTSLGLAPALRGSTALRRRLRAVGFTLAALGFATTVGCAETPTVQYSAAQLLGMWNESMKNLADKHAGCPYERDLPFNHEKGACYPLKCKNSGDEAALLRKGDGTVYKCDAGCNGGCSSIARF